MFKLVSSAETYEKIWLIPDMSEEKCPVFILKKLSGAEVNRILDETTKMQSDKTGKMEMRILSGTAQELHIKYALVGWRNVYGDDNKEVPCNDVNKQRLPADIISWLNSDIINVNKLAGYTEEERKNS